MSLKDSAREHVPSLFSFHGLPESLHLVLLLTLLLLLCYAVCPAVTFLSRGFLPTCWTVCLLFAPWTKTTACTDEREVQPRAIAVSHPVPLLGGARLAPEQTGATRRSASHLRETGATLGAAALHQ